MKMIDYFYFEWRARKLSFALRAQNAVEGVCPTITKTYDTAESVDRESETWNGIGPHKISVVQIWPANRQVDRITTNSSEEIISHKQWLGQSIDCEDMKLVVVKP